MALGLIFAGCGQAEFSSTFERDGSGAHSLSFTIPRADFEQTMENDEADATLDLISEQAAEGGLRVERVLTQEQVTLRITTIDQAEGDASAALNSLLNASGINANPGISAPFKGDFRRESGAVGGNRFILDMTVDGQDLYNSMDVLSLRIRQDATPLEIRSNISIVYQATFPGDVTKTNGLKVNSTTVRWTIPTEGEIRIHAESRLAGSGSAALFVTAGLISLLAVMALAAIIAFILVRRNDLTTRLTAASEDFPRQTTITHEGIWVAHRIRGYIEHLRRRSGPESRSTHTGESSEARREGH